MCDGRFVFMLSLVMKLIALVLFLSTACVTHSPPPDDTVEPGIACQAQSDAWCMRAFVEAYPAVPVTHWYAQEQLTQCNGWYLDECATGEPMTRTELDTCLADIASNWRWECVPLSCAASWTTGLGKSEPSHWCQI